MWGGLGLWGGGCWLPLALQGDGGRCPPTAPAARSFLCWLWSCADSAVLRSDELGPGAAPVLILGMV